MVTAFALTAFALTACSGESQLEAPTMVTIDNLHDATVEIAPHRPLEIPVGEGKDSSAWTEGGVDDETVAEFVPGGGDGSSETNPSFRAVSQGTTGAHLTVPDTGEVITFTLVVE